MAEAPEENPGEGQPPQDESAPGGSETAAGHEAKSTEAIAEDERRALLDQLAQEVLQRIRGQLPATPPPTETLVAPVASPFEQQATELQGELKSLNAEVATAGGWTAETLLRRQDLYDRVSQLRSNVVLHGMRLQEEGRQVDALGKEDRWKEYYQKNRHRGDADLLRSAFEREEQKRSPARPTAPAVPGSPKIDVSGPSELTATQRKAKEITREQVRARKAEMEQREDFAGIRNLDRELRNGGLLLTD